MKIVEEIMNEKEEKRLDFSIIKETFSYLLNPPLSSLTSLFITLEEDLLKERVIKKENDDFLSTIEKREWINWEIEDFIEYFMYIKKILKQEKREEEIQNAFKFFMDNDREENVFKESLSSLQKDPEIKGSSQVVLGLLALCKQLCFKEKEEAKNSSYVDALLEDPDTYSRLWFFKYFLDLYLHLKQGKKREEEDWPYRGEKVHNIKQLIPDNKILSEFIVVLHDSLNEKIYNALWDSNQEIRNFVLPFLPYFNYHIPPLIKNRISQSNNVRERLSYLDYLSARFVLERDNSILDEITGYLGDPEFTIIKRALFLLSDFNYPYLYQICLEVLRESHFSYNQKILEEILELIKEKNFRELKEEVFFFTTINNKKINIKAWETLFSLVETEEEGYFLTALRSPYLRIRRILYESIKDHPNPHLIVPLIDQALTTLNNDEREEILSVLMVYEWKERIIPYAQYYRQRENLPSPFIDHIYRLLRDMLNFFRNDKTYPTLLDPLRIKNENERDLHSVNENLRYLIGESLKSLKEIQNLTLKEILKYFEENIDTERVYLSVGLLVGWGYKSLDYIKFRIFSLERQGKKEELRRIYNALLSYLDNRFWVSQEETIERVTEEGYEEYNSEEREKPSPPFKIFL